jgi:hypothetical protein
MFVLMLAIIIACSASAREYHVSPSGDDQNPGTKNRPYRTISRAADQMRTGDVCTVHNGTYGETVRPKHSGTARQPIVFRTAVGETVRITGTDVITGWEPETPGIYQAPMPSSLGNHNQVFFDEHMMTEARWPNKTSASLMVADGAKISSGDNGWIICNNLPDNLADNALTGAVIWVMAKNKWSSWTATVTGYVAEEKKILFPPSATTWIADYHNPSGGGTFYLTGSATLFDAENEWYYANGKVHIRPPQGMDPRQHQVHAKTRSLAFDLSNRKHVIVAGFRINAATIALTHAEDCTVTGITATYVSHTRGGQTVADVGEPSGIDVSGKRNCIRDSEIAFSAGNGITLAGERQQVINCWIHDTDYMGCYNSPVKVTGYGHLVSHCTLQNTGRDCMYLEGAGHLIEYNDLSHAGLLASDLGLLYTGGNDGGETEIHHNVLHDVGSPDAPGHYFNGLYLDNYTSNYVLHHNLIRNCGTDLRVSNPSSYVLIMNNSFACCVWWGRWPEKDRMVGDYLINNQGEIAVHRDYGMIANTEKLSMPGVSIPGITGTIPGTGAYEGRAPFIVGHDFNQHPQPVYRLAETPYTNRVMNGTFDLITSVQSGDLLRPWKRSLARKAIVINAPGFDQDYDTRTSIFGNSVHLPGTPSDGIEQQISGLVANAKYILAAQVKTAGGATMRIGIRDASGRRHEITSRSTTWEMLSLVYEAGAHPAPVTVYLIKDGNGIAYADTIGLQAVFPTAGGGCHP